MHYKYGGRARKNFLFLGRFCFHFSLVFYILGRFCNKTIITLALVEYEMITSNSALRVSRNSTFPRFPFGFSGCVCLYQYRKAVNYHEIQIAELIYNIF